MPDRFDSGTFDPELARLMKGVFESAWAKLQISPQHSEEVGYRLAEAIVAMANAGVRDGDHLVASALVALASAKSISGEWMIRGDQTQ